MKTTIAEKDRLLKFTLDELSTIYPLGLYEWLYKDNLEVYRQMLRLEDSINDNFTNNESILDLKAILREYWILHMKAIRNFELRGKPKLPLGEVRSERIDTLERRHL